MGVHSIMERLQLMDLLLELQSAPSSTELNVFKTVKYFGKEVLEANDKRIYEDFFKRAKNKLSEEQLLAGRRLGIFVNPEEEHIFGPNMVYVAQNQRLPDDVATCKDRECRLGCSECREVAGLVKTVIDKGGLDTLS